MAEASTRTGHRSLDFPELETLRYHSPDVLPLVLLFKSTTAQRDELIIKFKPSNFQGGKDSPIEVVPWLRSFTPIRSDLPLMASPQCILVDRELLEDDLCIICHGLVPAPTPPGRAIFEFATVKIPDAYKIVTSAQWKATWFPDTLPQSQELQVRSEPTYVSKTLPDPPFLSDKPDRAGEIIAFITVPITSEQKQQIRNILLSPMDDDVFLLELPNPSDELDDIDHLMELFLVHAWFPGDFAIVDAQTLTELSAITNQDDDAGEYPSLILATSLQIWNRGCDDQIVSVDEVGYAVARRVMEDEEEYKHWCINAFRGMGLRGYIGWEDAADFEGDLYYWSCWLDENGRVDGEVRGEIDVRS